MSIIEKIKNSVESATGLQMYYHAVGHINAIFDNVELPAAYSFLIESGAVTDQNGRYHERVTIGVFFVNLTDYDFNAIENEDIINECKRSAFVWLQSLRLNADLRLVSVNNSQRVYDTFDANLTGYGVNITLEEIDGLGSCNA